MKDNRRIIVSLGEGSPKRWWSRVEDHTGRCIWLQMGFKSYNEAQTAATKITQAE